MLTMKDVIREGHDTLRIKAQDVELPVSDEDKQTLFSMLEFLKNSQDEELAEKYKLRPGVGLAAPQINKSMKMMAVHTTDETGDKLYSYMLINPKIISHSEEITFLPQGEGCLSVDREVKGLVPRYRRITVLAHQLQEDGSVNEVRIRLKNYVGIVFQHEIDHLNGILFMDRINKENPFGLVNEAKPIQF
ncbi:peptide deformylase [Haloplasma contractile]|uniref:Peptide deformylase n=1 Tax=Haloplasma contractile SSD-17B TaxID=1033810 RepID=U2FL44_9MOLU|nr:peptide deformylase [Haloplasma contractile]ERJ13485.1 Peptide deformylase 2 protein [Haloplasma contractile SSD-17B]